MHVKMLLPEQKFVDCLLGDLLTTAHPMELYMSCIQIANHCKSEQNCDECVEQTISARYFLFLEQVKLFICSILSDPFSLRLTKRYCTCVQV